MKILLATPYFYPRIGGLELYAQSVAGELTKRGHEVHIVTAGERTETVVWRGLVIHRLRTWAVVSNTPVSPLWFWQVRRLVRELQPDVINVHAPVPSMALAAAAAAGRTPLVVTYHAGSMKKSRVVADAAITVYEAVALPWLLRRAERIICASDFVRDAFLSKWQSKSVTVTPGVDTNLFVPSLRPAVSGRVVFVGDFRDPRKGLAVLRQAVMALPGVSLRVIGQGEPERQERVSYAGIKRGRELVAELQQAQLLVLPSTTEAESFGMVLVEAMACGLPVVGSRIGGIGHVISDGVDGLLVPAGDAGALAAAMSVILGNPDYARELGRAGRRKAVSRMAWASRGAQTEAVLAEAAAGRQLRGRAEVRHG